MKKNISINISGIIFHIEEDGYETLKKYLDSINRYFSTFEDSSEILADIESRIAEIFLSKLNEEKQVITSEDVNGLVATMGSVSDFKAVEDAEKEAERESERNSSSTYDYRTTSDESSRTFIPSKQLMRDQKRKLLGGVCAGLANYFNVDALWVRLLFALLAFAYGITIFIYIIMWIVVPGSYDLDEPIVGKKMYRNPDKKIIGGVASGVAAFLGLDLVAVRILFVILAIFGGIGFFIYIILWLILPEAKSLTDRIQMQGDPVTLSNIESTLKKNQSEKVVQEESTLTQIILFPFRIIGIVLNALAQVLGRLGEVLRVLVGILIVIVGLGLILSMVVSAGILFGLFTNSTMPWVTGVNEAGLPIEPFIRAFPGWTAVAAFFAGVIPALFLVLLGVSAIAKRIIFNAATGWSLFALFFISMAILAVSIPKIVFAFKEDAGYTVENTYRVNNNRAVLRVNETGLDEYNGVYFTLEGHDGSDFRLVQKFEAQGGTRQGAIENAKMVEYNVNVQDSIFTFDSNLRFKDDAIFRAQRLHMTLFIPYNFPFVMDEGTSRLIKQYIDSRYLDNYVWHITKEDGLECVSCPKPEKEKFSDLRDYDGIEVKGKFDMRIVRGHDYLVELTGPDDAKDQYKISKRGETLIIEYQGKKDVNWKLKDLNIQEVELTITVPDLEKVEATGVGTIKLDDFASEDMAFDLRGPVKLKGDIQVTNLNINLTGSAEADLSGRAQMLEARIEFASVLHAYGLEAQNAFVETSGASTAKVNVVGTLEMEEGVASKIDYRGNPQIMKH